MALTTQDGLVAAMAGGQTLLHNKVARSGITGAIWYSTFDRGGNPGAGTLAGTSTAAGVVPTDATAGTPNINAFSGSNTGYIASVDFGGSVACRLALCDMLFKAGAYTFSSAVTLASQPSYSSRVPSGTDYNSTQIWFEAASNFTGNPSVAVTYTNQSGTAGRTTGTVAVGTAPTSGQMFNLPLQAGDTGVQKIESVTATVATVGTFNILVLRPLWMGRVRAANDGALHGPDLTDLPQVWTDSALIVQVIPDSTSTGVSDLLIGVING